MYFAKLSETTCCIEMVNVGCYEIDSHKKIQTNMCGSHFFVTVR